MTDHTLTRSDPCFMQDTEIKLWAAIRRLTQQTYQTRGDLQWETSHQK